MPDSTFSAGPVHHPKARPSASAAPALRGAPGFQVLLVTREPWVFRSRLSCFSTTRRRVSQIGSASPKPSPCCALTPRQHFLRSMKAALTPPTYDQPSAVDFAQPRLVGVRSLTHARNERALSTTLDGSTAQHAGVCYRSLGGLTRDGDDHRAPASTPGASSLGDSASLFRPAPLARTGYRVGRRASLQPPDGTLPRRIAPARDDP